MAVVPPSRTTHPATHEVTQKLLRTAWQQWSRSMEAPPSSYVTNIFFPLNDLKVDESLKKSLWSQTSESPTLTKEKVIKWQPEALTTGERQAHRTFVACRRCRSVQFRQTIGLRHDHWFPSCWRHEGRFCRRSQSSFYDLVYLRYISCILTWVRSSTLLNVCQL